MTIADLIAENLPSLTHPGDGKPFALNLPVFRTAALPPQMATQFAADAGLPSSDIAKLTAEAITALIENNHVVLTKTEAQQLHDAANANETHRHRAVPFGCHCGNPLFTANISDYGTDHPRVNGPQLIKAISQINPDCNTKHGAP
jgi:hypothetical protein